MEHNWTSICGSCGEFNGKHEKDCPIWLNIIAKLRQIVGGKLNND